MRRPTILEERDGAGPVGEFDEADPPTLKRQARMSPGAKYAVIPGAAHLVEWDNPDETNRVILAFLKSVASAKTDAVTPNLTRP